MLCTVANLPDLSGLTAALPGNSLSFDGVEDYAIDGMSPSVIVKPASQAEAAAALAAADASGAAVVPFGGGTRQSLGMPPRRYDVALDLTRIDLLVEHEPADLTVSVEAGMRLSALQRLLGERGQWLPFDPPCAPEATIGGLLAANDSGPARLSRGTGRDLVIGMTVATAEGQLVKSGGRVVKNVAGYDMAKLHIGALGTLGVILQVSLKVSPLPVHTAIAGIRGGLDALVNLSKAVEAARLPLQGSVIARGNGAEAWMLALRYAGGEAAVERSLKETRELAQAASLTVEELSTEAWQALQVDADTASTLLRGSVLPTAVPSLVEALSTAGADVSAMPGVGVVYGAWKAEVAPDTVRKLRSACEGRGGALVIEKAPLALKQAVDAWGAPRGDFSLMQRLKQELDPHGTLNPGRYLGGM